MEINLLQAVTDAGTTGITTGELFGDARFSVSAVGVTNALASLRAKSLVTTRRETRNGERVQVYYTVENAPSGTPRGEAS